MSSSKCNRISLICHTKTNQTIGLSKDGVGMNNYGACDAELDDENLSKKSSKEDLQKLMKISPTHQKSPGEQLEDNELGIDSTINRDRVKSSSFNLSY